MARHWSFVVCDKKYVYPVAVMLLACGLWAAVGLKQPQHFNRAGNFIMAVGVWISMRHAFREGINRHKDHADTSPVIPGTNQLNPAFFNQIAFSIGDAQLQLHGFALVIIGSMVGSLGDVALRFGLPRLF